MADWEDVRQLALALPETDEHVSRGNRHWRVKEKLFVWERPLSRREVEQLGGAAPTGPVLGARVEHVGVKKALIAEEPALYFTTSHFDGYPAVLVRLERIGAGDLEELVTEAWFARAPAKLAKAHAERLQG
jgi:hypothetical protein